MKIAIIVSDFNKEITDNLLQGCLQGLHKLNINNKQIDVFHVPGAFEMPLKAKIVAKTKKYQCIIALGAVIKGETDHYTYVCKESARGIMHVQLETEIPIVFGVLTVRKYTDAVNRSSIKYLKKNKGYQSAMTAGKLLNF